MDRLLNRVEPFAALFWALSIVLYLPTPDSAPWPSLTPLPYTKHVPFYGHAWFNSQQRRVCKGLPFCQSLPRSTLHTNITVGRDRSHVPQITRKAS